MRTQNQGNTLRCQKTSQMFIISGIETLKIIQKQNPSSDPHRTKSGGPNIKSEHHILSNVRTPSVLTKCIVITSSEPGMSPASHVRTQQKARSGLNLVPGRTAVPELCISTQEL